MLQEQSDSGQESQRKSVIFSVEQLNSHIRQTLEGQLGVVWLKAEISNFKPHSSGHFYFSLKDQKAQISAIMFRGHNSKLKFKPHDGLEVIVRGRITVYEPRGTYQIVCESMEPVGAGALQKQFEQLRDKLKAEGLFDQSRKKPIPPYPKHVAIVTSPTGAAIQDILNIMKRRARGVEITLVPALVQGPQAAASICDSFQKAIRLNPDVIIVGRGGGSIEDLWSFNDENLARLIAACEIPVISAVGHEIDFTICDFVSDLRAPTPSAAAELVAKSSVEILQKLRHLDQILQATISKTLKFKNQQLQMSTRRLVDPKRTLQDYAFRNDELLDRLQNSITGYLDHLKKDVQILETRLISPTEVLKGLYERLAQLKIRMGHSTLRNITDYQHRLKHSMSLLNSLSPLQVVDRGYSIVKTEGHLVKSIKSLKAKDVIEVEVHDGTFKAEIVSVQASKKVNQKTKD